MKTTILLTLLFAAASHAAGLKFENERNEVHADLSAAVVKSDFKFTNTSNKTVKINKADAGCSCMAVEVSDGKLSYAPGESGVLRTTFEIGTFQGAVDKTILIWMDGDPEDKPSGSVMLRVHIPVIIALEPKTLKWETGEKPSSKMIEVKMDYEKPIHVTSVSTSNSGFTAELVTVEAGKAYSIKVTPTDTKAGGLSVIRIETDLDLKKHQIQQGFAVVRAPISNK